MDLDSDIDFDFNPDALAKEINGIDFPKPQITPEPDSGLIAYRNMFSDDKIDRMRGEPCNKNNPLLNIGFEKTDSIDSVYTLRGDVSSLFEADDQEADDEMLY